jgi:hypothetical protein
MLRPNRNSICSMHACTIKRGVRMLASRQAGRVLYVAYVKIQCNRALKRLCSVASCQLLGEVTEEPLADLATMTCGKSTNVSLIG